MILPEHTAAARAGWVRRDRRPIWQVADNRYGMDRTRGHGEKWQLSRSPWVRQVLDDCQSHAVREVVLMAGSQCAKTAPMLVVLAWGCANEPGPTLWITGNDDLAKDASLERVQPTLERCPDTRPLIQDNRLDKTTWKVRLTTMTLDIAGAQSSTVLEQNPYARIFADEVRQWPAGSLQKIEKRQRSFTNAKRFLFSTPNLKDDEFHERYKAGTRCEWVWPCMGCGAENKLEWKDLKYEQDGSGGEGQGRGGDSRGEVYVACGACGFQHPDLPSTRRAICEKGHWEAQNPTPQAGVVSYHWNALLPPWVRWPDLVAEWKRANELKRQGNVEPLKVFITETLGEPWEERAEESTGVKLLSRRAPGVLMGAKPDGGVTFAAADVQQDVVYWAVRNWRPGAKSMLVDAGKSFTMADLTVDVVQRYLPAAGHLVIDCGYKPEDVFALCRQYGWRPFRGDKSTYYVVQNVRQVWQARLQGAPPIKVTWFSSAGVKDVLASYMAGESGEWHLPEDVPQEYVDQLLSEHKVQKITKDGIPTGQWEWKQIKRNNHWLDCECMGIVAALDYSLWAVNNGQTPLIGGL